MSTWTDHVARWKDCTDCSLCEQRRNIVLARAGVAGGITKGGQLPCDVVFIGEAPGMSEDDSGLPFWGPAGDILQQVIERALPPGVTYAMTNLVACFPREAKGRGDNEPERDEILECRPRLVEFINIARPKLIVCVGSLAARYVDHNAGVSCVDIIHPAATMGNRMPAAQRQMAIQKSIVVLRRAVEDVLESKGKNFTNRGDNHASVETHVPRRYEPYPDDIPF